MSAVYSPSPESTVGRFKQEKDTRKGKSVISLEIHGQVGIKVLVQLFIAGSSSRRSSLQGQFESRHILPLSSYLRVQHVTSEMFFNFKR